ncbi:MAG: hypothetical protein U0136_00555 [Bdellovibrionota bacterium]
MTAKMTETKVAVPGASAQLPAANETKVALPATGRLAVPESLDQLSAKTHTLFTALTERQTDYIGKGLALFQEKVTALQTRITQSEAQLSRISPSGQAQVMMQMLQRTIDFNKKAFADLMKIGETLPQRLNDAFDKSVKFLVDGERFMGTAAESSQPETKRSFLTQALGAFKLAWEALDAGLSGLHDQKRGARAAL